MANANQERQRDNDLDEYFMAVACLSALWSKDPNTKVGACIVNQDNKIVGIGYNCMPNGCEGQLPWGRDAEKWLEKKYAYVCHAELNAIMNKYSADVKGCTMFTSLFPCNECAKLIIQAGIEEVVFLSDKYHKEENVQASKTMLDKAGIECRQFKPERTEIIIDFNTF